MANIIEPDFPILDLSGENYVSWAVDAKIYLSMNNLGETIKEENTKSSQDRAKATVFLFRHLHKDYRMQYLMVTDPLELWNCLKERYGHMKQVVHNKSRYESNNGVGGGRIAKRKNLRQHRLNEFEDVCYKCGTRGHWSRTCRTPKHLVELYQASIKKA